MNVMKVVVFGASGRTGRQLLKQGLANGHQVTAFVRNPARIAVADPRIRVVHGDVADRAAVEAAIEGQDAVLCALGARSLSRRDEAFVVGVHNIVTAMESLSVCRLVYLSADTVHDTRRDLNVLRRVIVPVLFHNSSADHELNERLIRQSRVAWSIVRPPMLTNGKPTGIYRSGEHLRARSVIPQLTRADLATFMLEELNDDSLVHQAVEVMQ
jgi:putative NADH-flavin reductase